VFAILQAAPLISYGTNPTGPYAKWSGAAVLSRVALALDLCVGFGHFL